MRSLLLAVLLLTCVACASADPFAGIYSVTVTGNDAQTAPSNSPNNPVSGMGSLAVSGDKDNMGYIVLFGENGYTCRVRATRTTGVALELTVTDGQTCQIGSGNATTTGGKVTIDSDTMKVGTLTVSYTYAYTGLLGINYAGTGMRTYTGTRL